MKNENLDYSILAKTASEIPKNITEGINEGINQTIPNIQSSINDLISTWDINPYEFVGRIDGPPLTQLRKQ